MSAKLEFIIGRSGSGRTGELFSRAAAAHRGSGRCFVIVQDQATFETERSLSRLLGGGLYNCGVYSWSSLARAVLDAMGERRAFLAPQGKLMLTRRAADACASRLRIFGSASAFKGFPKECDTLIRRFKSCAVTPEALMEASEKLPEGSPLGAKLADISLIYSECERLMSERFIDSEDMMNALYGLLPSSALAGAHVFIDGANTMNEQCCRVFSAMLGCCESVTATFCLDGGGADRALFEPEQRMLERLSDIASQAGVRPKTTLLPAESHGRAPALRFLEQQLFSHPHAVYHGVPEGLSCYVAKDRQDEAAEAAQQIRLAANGGMRYRDMAVAVSDPAAYAPIIERVFKAFGIPYFMDEKKPVSSYPIARLILSGLTAVQKGFDAVSVLRVLKTGYCEVSEEDAERFENHLVATGIFGSRLTVPFENAPEGAERARKAVMEPLMELKESVRVGTAAQRTEAIYHFISGLNVYQKQKELCAGLHERGMFKQEEENARVFNIVLELLDQLYVILGDGEIGLARFISVVREGLASYEIGVIPTTCDQVLVGDVGRTAFGRVRFMQVLGMNEGLFPARRVNEGVIDDGDLKVMSDLGLSVWHNSDQLCRKDELDVYNAFSKPTERMRFCYPIDPGGELTPPCALFGRITDIFPEIPIENGVERSSLRADPRLAMKRLAAEIRRMADSGAANEAAKPLYAYFSRKSESRGMLDSIERICFEGSSPAPFGPEAASRLYGGALYGSASRLETFNRCPFCHFMRYGIGAKEREEHGEKNTDVGTFYHEAIEAFTNYVADNDIDWRELDDEAVFAALRELLPPLMAAYKNGILYETARQRAKLVTMMETVRATCCAITRQIARGSFRPFGTEVRFGSAESVFPPLKITAADGTAFYISGIIDRIDVWNEPAAEGGAARAHSRIIDYKTGGKSFDFAELAAGIQLQLPLYAAAVSAAQELQSELGAGDTVGMYYMPVRGIAAEDAEDTALAPEASPPGEEKVFEFKEKLMKKFALSGVSLGEANIIAAAEDFEKSATVISARYNAQGEVTGSGIVSRSEYEAVIEDAKRIAAGTIGRIMAGHAEVSPARRPGAGSAACAYCPYGDVCRFDPDPGRDVFRIIPRLGANGYFGRDSGD